MASSPAAAAGLEDRSLPLEIATIILLALAVTTFSLRAYVRSVLMNAFGLDDWLMAAATAVFIVYCACVLGGVDNGTGRHMDSLSEEDAATALEFWFGCYLAYSWTMILSKLSIGIFLLRIVSQRIYTWTIYTAMFLSALTGIIFFFVSMLQCSPVPYFWDRTIQGGSCISVEVIIVMAYLYSSVNILCDFTFALLPIAIVRGLNMAPRMKLAVLPLLTIGCVASCGVVARLVYLPTFRDPDFLYSTVGIAIWSTVEAGLAITAGSLACVRPAFKLLFSGSGRSINSQPHKGAGQRPFPATIGSARARKADMFPMDSPTVEIRDIHSDDSAHDTSPTPTPGYETAKEALDWMPDAKGADAKGADAKGADAKGADAKGADAGDVKEGKPASPA